MIREIGTILKVKIWFATVNQYRGLKARYKLWQYERTLSPKNREYSQNLRNQLRQATKPGEATAILIRESRRLQDEQFRAIERIDQVEKSLQKT